jgi:cytoskeleton protein RodZ
VIAKSSANPHKEVIMSTVAEQLRQAREAQNLTIHQVADVTKIRTDHIRALEEGNFNVFSAPVYIRGFVRNYATLLKLEVPSIMSALEAELGRTEKFSEPPPLSQPPRGVLDFLMLQLSKVDWRKALIGAGAAVVVIILVSLYLSWRNHRTRDPASGLKPGLYQPAKTNTGEKLPVPAPAPRR